METTNISELAHSSNNFHQSNKFCMKGILMADEGLLKEALENFNKAIEVNPNNHIAFFNRATIKVDLGDLDGAKIDFNRFDLLTEKSSVNSTKFLL